MKLLLLIPLLAIIAIAGCVGQAPTAAPPPGIAPPPAAPPGAPTAGTQYTVSTLNMRTPHFVNSAPAHGEVYTMPPNGVIINTNFDVVPPSEIKIFKGTTDVTDGATEIGSDRLLMRAKIKKGFGDGEYVVRYHACWPDRSCHDGSFGFIVDSNYLAGSIADLRGQAEATVRMNNLAFSPRYLRVSTGTKVTFVNDEAPEHFVNSDPHPSHNLLAGYSSRGLLQGQSYEFTFTEPGEWHYHCSAHVTVGMDAIVIVE
jgi:plastocyanin